MRQRRKICLVILFSLVVIFLENIFNDGGKDTFAANNGYFVVTSDHTYIYDNRRGNERPLTVVGKLSKGQIFPIRQDYGENWWKIDYGNSFGYIHKSKTELVTKPDYMNGNSNLKNSKLIVKTVKPVSVYDNSSGKLVKFAEISKNMRYPVISKHGRNWWKVDVGGRIGYIYKPVTSVDDGIPVLMYHHLLKKEENKHFINVSTTIQPLQLEEQLKYLHDNGFETIYPSELKQYIEQKINLPAKSVLITFDDGLKSTYIYAYPILKKYNQRATNFIITGRIPSLPTPFHPDRLQFLSVQEMEEMKPYFNYEGHTNSMHSYTRGRVPYLLANQESEILKDLITNREKLLTINKKPSIAFAYPFGRYNRTTINNVRKAGFQMGLTTKPGRVNVGELVYEIKRYEIGPKMSLNQFISVVN